MPKDDTGTFPEYADEYIGECIAGSCDSPATVQIHKDFKHCALHALAYELGEEEDDMSIAAGMLRGWKSQSEYEGCGFLARVLDNALAECEERKSRAHSQRDQLWQVDREVMPNHDLRTAAAGGS